VAKPEASVLHFLRSCATPVHWNCPSPPRPARRSGAKRQCLAPVTPQQDSRVVGACRTKSKDLLDTDRDELWNYVWANVESPTPPPLPDGSPTPRGGMRTLSMASPPAPIAPLSSPLTGGPSPQNKIVPYVRRRLVGKQPPVLTIEVYTRRRLTGKQPEPLLSERKTISVRGHYDVLGVLRTANAAEIHAAYRRRALATHPDKGGDPKDFHRVKVAFEELSDDARRTVYDRNLVLFGRRDGMTSETKEPTVEVAQVVAQEKTADRLFYGAARVAHFTLLASNWTTWLGSLTQMQDGVLNTLRDILKCSKTLLAPADAGAGAGANGNLQGWQGPTCITQLKNGYKVTVSWAELSVSTGLTKSLTQVIDWQIALLSMQGAAQVRMKRRDRSESKDPLTENELLQVLEREPGLEPIFTISVNAGGKKGKKVSAPGVLDLRLAMDFRQKFLAASHGRNTAAALKAEKRTADQEAAKEKKRHKICEQQLLIAVNQELQARRAGRSRGTGDQSSKALVLHQARRQESVKAPTPDAKGNWLKDQTKTSPCKVSRKRRTQVEAPVRKQRV